MLRGAVDVVKALARGLVHEFVRVTKIAVPTMFAATMLLFVFGAHPVVAVVGGILAGVVAAGIAIEWANDSDDGPPARRRPHRTGPG